MLREYQKKGVEWLINTPVGILADDMGLGKTVQTIKAMEYLFENETIENCIIVAPLSLQRNWEIEISKWAPSLRYERLRSSDNTNTAILKKLGSSKIIITNYESLKNSTDYFKTIDFDLMIADEVHKIRKSTSQISEAVFNFKKKRFWGLTGTPIENNVDDLLNLLSHLTGKNINPKDKQRSPLFLLELMKPYILRRMKSQVLDELPKVTEVDYPVELLDVQLKEYSSTWQKRYEIADNEGSHFSVLSKLRKICDGGKEFEVNAKTIATGELIRKIHENKEKVIVFSYYLDPLYGLEELLKTIDIPYVKFFDVDVDAREESVDTFRSDATVTVFIASSRIASEGLTLTEANNVIFLNRWWNPSSNSQARDRVVRIGQERPVTIYNLFCVDTVEERVTQILKDKNDIYSKVTDGLVDDLSSLTKEIIDEPKN